MRLILVSGDDYSAVTFGQSNMSVFDAYEKAINNGGEFQSKTEDGFFKVNAFEFGEVDTEFINFIKDEIEDYDMAKDKTFYIVED